MSKAEDYTVLGLSAAGLLGWLGFEEWRKHHPASSPSPSPSPSPTPSPTPTPEPAPSPTPEPAPAPAPSPTPAPPGTQRMRIIVLPGRHDAYAKAAAAADERLARIKAKPGTAPAIRQAERSAVLAHAMADFTPMPTRGYATAVVDVPEIIRPAGYVDTPPPPPAAPYIPASPEPAGSPPPGSTPSSNDGLGGWFGTGWERLPFSGIPGIPVPSSEQSGFATGQAVHTAIEVGGRETWNSLIDAATGLFGVGFSNLEDVGKVLGAGNSPGFQRTIATDRSWVNKLDELKVSDKPKLLPDWWPW